jgi:hypothetical protein
MTQLIFNDLGELIKLLKNADSLGAIDFAKLLNTLIKSSENHERLDSFVDAYVNFYVRKEANESKRKDEEAAYISLATIAYLADHKTNNQAELINQLEEAYADLAKYGPAMEAIADIIYTRER